jgi:hypothetical protein
MKTKISWLLISTQILLASNFAFAAPGDCWSNNLPDRPSPQQLEQRRKEILINIRLDQLDIRATKARALGFVKASPRGLQDPDLLAEITADHNDLLCENSQLDYIEEYKAVTVATQIMDGYEEMRIQMGSSAADARMIEKNFRDAELFALSQKTAEQNQYNTDAQGAY